MAKNYKIVFSGESETTTIKEISEDGKRLIEKEKPLAELEKDILAMLTKFAIANMGDPEDINVALDFKRQIEDSDDHVILDKTDWNNLKDGVKQSAGKRPDAWYECGYLWAQISKPEEIKVEEKADE